MGTDEVKQRLCALTSEVATEVYGNRKASDCWCGLTTPITWVSVEEPVIKFIEKAVRQAIKTNMAANPHCHECGAYIGPDEED